MKEFSVEEANTFASEFLFTRVLGWGRHGKVFEGKCKKNGDKRALKVIKSSCETCDAELRILDVLPDHPHIMRTESSFRLGPELSVFVMRLSDMDLRSFIKKQPDNKLDEKQCAPILAGLSSALSFLLRHSVFHRDLKPDNILLETCGECDDTGAVVVKLCDFGLAERIDSKDQVFHRTMGSGYYLAPEIWKRSGYTTKSDLYSVGAIFYEMLCGQPPFHFAGDAVELEELAVNHPIPKDCLPKSLSMNAKNLLGRLMRKAPAARIEW
eukprot:CAMPEP_0201507098 /NCGR_PEP_ID=MMETSP0161_2-20130828/872_1 /ASSEMBLY_ACC=CAM_ASM_000251 /TAXON_ID=180227 /ORGANISM="Neoparamoeba aestuarina, Strain SoJaBio B1-5/56/2" /LENGTH=267 /DNA_ID=CAMNT_0047901375 /DNA_START=65 /DNA_END=865 /DNA_ORIENTATION=-